MAFKIALLLLAPTNQPRRNLIKFGGKYDKEKRKREENVKEKGRKRKKKEERGKKKEVRGDG
jgi:hypothetical protein